MKLLIADDEVLTREGLISAIDWNALGVHKIFQADDGVNALAIAKKEKPDIILSDIRMPRLSGVEMAEQLKNILPDASLIFMSGYSDKEYLKAAIKLNAIDYVEKPLNPDEIRSTVMEAIQRRQDVIRSRKSESLLSMETSSKLALLLTKPYREQEEAVHALSDELSLRLTPASRFVTYIARLRSTDTDTSLFNEMLEDFQDFLKNYHLHFFYIQVHGVYHVFHLMGKDSISDTALHFVEHFLKDRLASFGEFHIGGGEPVTGIQRVYQSYSSAVIATQSCFFFPVGTLLKEQDLLENTVSSRLIFTEFQEALLEKNEDRCRAFLEQTFLTYNRKTGILPNQVKDEYYQLFMILSDCRRKLKIQESSTFREGILEYLEKCFSYEELHRGLEEETAQFFEKIGTYEPEDSTIFLIKDYIDKNYANDALSIKEISEHVFLSTSYVCTYFKAQTGQTLNQYLTEYRMEKAKPLLADARYQITDISSKVGYSNGNYFSKSFKKFTGDTPSKYREKVLG